MKAYPTSPSEIRRIFANNMKFLVKQFSSLSEMSRVLGIERTKLSRYMNQTASPGPEVLAKICNYFEVSADVMYAPINNSQDGTNQSLGSARKLYQQISSRSFEVRKSQLPNGLYAQWETSATRPGKYVVNISRVYDEHGCVYFKAYDNISLYGNSPAYRAAKLRKAEGIVLGSDTGFSVLFFNPVLNYMIFYSFSYGYKLLGNLHRGDYLFSKHYDANLNLKGIVALQFLENGFKQALSLARGKHYFDFDELPEPIKIAISQT